MKFETMYFAYSQDPKEDFREYDAHYQLPARNEYQAREYAKKLAEKKQWRRYGITFINPRNRGLLSKDNENEK